MNRLVLPLGERVARVFEIAPGQKVADVTDAADAPENAARILALAAGADALFIEAVFLAVFLEADCAAAERTRHLTAARAGALARAAGVRRALPFHHSARYAECPEAPAEAFRSAFEGEAPRPPETPAVARHSREAVPVKSDGRTV